MKGGYASMDHMNEGIRRAVRVSLAERDMTQSDLAEKIGVSPQYVSRIMQGQVGKIPPAWLRILDTLGLELVAMPKGSTRAFSSGFSSAFAGGLGSPQAARAAIEEADEGEPEE
jgi:transcriptional regulator with XRE-family HTH domain